MYGSKLFHKIINHEGTQDNIKLSKTIIFTKIFRNVFCTKNNINWQLFYIGMMHLMSLVKLLQKQILETCFCVALLAV